MRVHQIAPPYVPVSSDISYGGTERVMFQLDRALISLGHETSMSAPRNSKPYGVLYETVDPIGFGTSRKLGDFDTFLERLYHMYVSLKTSNEGNFDVVHIHDENLIPFASFINKPVVSTVCSIPEEFWNPNHHPKTTDSRNLVAVSYRLREIYNNAGFNIEHVVYNGFDLDRGQFIPEKTDYLFTMGIIGPQKGQAIAVEVAKRLGKSIIIGGNIRDQDYFDHLKQSFTHSIESEENKLEAYKRLPPGRKVVYAGNLTDTQKFPLFGNAEAFLVPSTMEEPFGLVLIEAMACGTPVIGFRKGAIPEIILHGETGYVADDIDGMTEMARQPGKINPFKCRSSYEERFTSEAMAKSYLEVYREVIKNG